VRRNIRIGFWWGKLKRKRQLGRPKHGRDHGTNIYLSRNSRFVWLGTGAYGGMFGTVMKLLVSLIVCLRTIYLLSNNMLHGKM
jgi:hypothetical protein